jgi:hypothetical protein
MNRGQYPPLPSALPGLGATPKRHDGAATAVARAILATTLGVLLASFPLHSSADDVGIRILSSKAEFSFAQQVTFTAQIASDATVTSVRLFYKTSQSDRTRSHDADTELSDVVVASHRQDLRMDPLSPFATVTFWWEIADSEGRRLRTEPDQFRYTDNRFSWESLQADAITVHWIEGRGDTAFGQAALDIAIESKAQISRELATSADRDIEIYVYDSQQNLDAAMVLAGRDWISGQAHPDLGVAVVAVPFGEDYGSVSRMERYIPHELTHLLVYRIVGENGYRSLPDWLDEGLATANELMPTPEYALAVQKAYDSGQLLNLANLCVPFSPNPATAFLSYAQSGSVVRFVRDQYGAVGIRALLESFASGSSCAGGVEHALGISMEDLETAWRASLAPERPQVTLGQHWHVWVGVWLLGLLVSIPMLGSWWQPNTSG